MESFDLLFFNHSFWASPFHFFIFIPPVWALIKVLAPEEPSMHQAVTDCLPVLSKTISINMFAKFAEENPSVMLQSSGRNIWLQIFKIDPSCKYNQSTKSQFVLPVAVSTRGVPNPALLNWQISSAILFMSLWVFNGIITIFFRLPGGHKCFSFFPLTVFKVFLFESIKCLHAIYPQQVFWWLCKACKCTSVSFQEINKIQTAYFHLEDVKKKSLCCIDPAGPSGLHELVLTVCTARALTSL